MPDPASFSDLVREAFIDPLRSVLIVDDQYPTWEEILNSGKKDEEKDDVLETRSAKKEWTTQPNGPLDVIKELRSRKPGFVIDIHDPFAPTPGSAAAGAAMKESPSELADHLHQSDLLVLDYNLEGEAGNLGGRMARDILRKVLENNHFNLVIVHTGEKDLSDVMTDCLLSLMQSCTSRFDENLQNRLKNLDETLDELERENKFERKLLDEKFSIDDYLNMRWIYASIIDASADYKHGNGVFLKLHGWATDLKLTKAHQSAFLFWAIRQLEKPKLAEFGNRTAEGLCWNDGSVCKWLRTTRGFVTFVKKGPGDLLGEMQKALENWKPTPSRLLSAKYRHVLNSLGVEAEDRSLQNGNVFAQFYDSIMEPARDGIIPAQATLLRQFKLKDHVSRQSEAMSFLIEDEIVSFGEKIVDADEAGSGNFAAHYGVDLSDAATKKASVDQFNSYVSTLPMKTGSDQLDSGHIFKLGNDWWVCATPACDLQPGQNTIAFTGSSKDLRPFTALQLVPIKREELENDHINSGSCCFIHDPKTGEIVCLGLRSIPDEKKPATQKVTWRTFLAKDQGLISDGICKVIQLKLTGSTVQMPEFEGNVVAKLRYEYALNYIQRVGASVSRIGLGYVAYPKSNDA